MANRFTVLSWNVLSPTSFDGKWLERSEQRIRSVREEILRQKPDILCLQEISQAFLDSLTQSGYRILVTSWKHQSTFGCSILCRKDMIEQFSICEMSFPVTKTSDGTIIPWCGTQITFQSTTFNIVNVHLTMDNGYVLSCYQKVLSNLTSGNQPVTNPLIICGDFNSGSYRSYDEWDGILKASQAIGDFTHLPTTLPDYSANKIPDHFFIINPVENGPRIEANNFYYLPEDSLIAGLPTIARNQKKVTVSGLSDHPWMITEFKFDAPDTLGHDNNTVSGSVESAPTSDSVNSAQPSAESTANRTKSKISKQDKRYHKTLPSYYYFDPKK